MAKSPHTIERKLSIIKKDLFFGYFNKIKPYNPKAANVQSTITADTGGYIFCVEKQNGKPQRSITKWNSPTTLRLSVIV